LQAAKNIRSARLAHPGCPTACGGLSFALQAAKNIRSARLAHQARLRSVGWPGLLARPGISQLKVVRRSTSLCTRHQHKIRFSYLDSSLSQHSSKFTTTSMVKTIPPPFIGATNVFSMHGPFMGQEESYEPSHLLLR
jgi:hypothetical protein